MAHTRSSNDKNAKLIIDLGKVGAERPSGIRCSYKHHPGNRGFDAVLERVRFELICRHCHSAPCVAACPQGALEKVRAADADSDEKTLARATMLCTGCGSCAIACPYGTVSDDLMVFASSVCDLCAGRLAPDEKPLCVRTSADRAVDYGPIESGAEAIEVLEGIVVRNIEAHVWRPLLRDRQRAEK